MRVFDTVTNLAQMSGRFFKPSDPSAEAGAGGGPLAQLETRLAGVVVAALKEAFDRDRARMDLERAHLEAERQRAEEALRAELRRQAADRALGQVRMVAMMAVAVWMLSAALGVWLPGMRSGASRIVLASGWACAIAALGCAFAGWQRITAWSGIDRLAGSRGTAVDTPTAVGLNRGGAGADIGPGIAERTAPWLLLGAITLSGAALLLAL
jgi:hypothetical protein